MKLISSIFIYTIVTIVLAMLLIPIKGDADYVNQNETLFNNNTGGPLESTHTSSRFFLTRSIIERKNVFLNETEAAIASPDISKVNDQIISIFTPGISLLALPFYLIGLIWHQPQLATLSFNFAISIINFFLIIKILYKVGVNKYTSIICSILFLFCTSLLPYIGTLTQHPTSVLLMLGMTLYSLKEKVNYFDNVIFGFCFGLGVLVDIPNAVMFLPLAIYFVFKQVRVCTQKLPIAFKIGLLLVGMLPVMFTFGLYNYKATGNPFVLGQRYGRHVISNDSTSEYKDIEIQTISTKKEKFKQFDTRRMLSGVDILLFSSSRGLITYAPISVIGLLGLFLLYKDFEKRNFSILMFSIISLNIILYSMFNDPWGGWSFGPRYLIPSMAILCIAAGKSIEKYRNIFFALLLFFVINYSLKMNILGALTTTVVPPKVYTQNLDRNVHHNYKFNLELIERDNWFSGSLVYNTFFKSYFKTDQFINLTVYIIEGVLLSLYVFSYFQTDNKRQK